MRLWVWFGAVVLLAACGGDEQVCAPLSRTDRRCDSTQFGLLRCNRAGTGYECDTSRECSVAVPCSILPVCVEYADPSVEIVGMRSSCAIACNTSADCAGSATRTCCAYSSTGERGCVVPNPLAGCIR